MRTLSQITDWMSENGYTMDQAESGYYYCLKVNDDGTETVAWMDSACEDAYEMDTALRMAYSIINPDDDGEDWEPQVLTLREGVKVSANPEHPVWIEVKK